MAVIALAGQKRSGKDSAADALVSLGYTKFAFADAVRTCVAQLDPIVGHWRGYGLVRLSDAFAEGWTWETIKGSSYSDEVRRLLQHMGTEVGRTVLGEQCWVDVADKHIALRRSDNWVIPDCRFANEAQWVRRNGGIVVRIVRPSTDRPTPEHASEDIDFDCDAVVVNDGSIADLHAAVEVIAKERL